MPSQIPRRTGPYSVGAALPLPFLDAMTPDVHAARSPATRLAYLYFSNGIPRGVWEPTKVDVAGRLVELNEWSRPPNPF